MISYRKTACGVGIAALFIVAIGCGSLANAFRRLWDDHVDIVLTNNLTECSPHVRIAIRRAKSSWGTFEFNCNGGVVREVVTSTTSRISLVPQTFIAHNLGLFDLDGSSITLAIKGDQGVQWHDGHEVPGTSVRRYFINANFPGGGSRGLTSRDLLRAPNVIPPSEYNLPQYSVIEVLLKHPDELDFTIGEENLH